MLVLSLPKIVFYESAMVDVIHAEVWGCEYSSSVDIHKCYLLTPLTPQCVDVRARSQLKKEL